ncbi:MAG TPA: hypothetical protein DDW52_28090 [Planctomycetaceae bacterium]|nr:hypothetical protein [Planctomycetaceae bacterium]
MSKTNHNEQLSSSEYADWTAENVLATLRSSASQLKTEPIGHESESQMIRAVADLMSKSLPFRRQNEADLDPHDVASSQSKFLQLLSGKLVDWLVRVQQISAEQHLNCESVDSTKDSEERARQRRRARQSYDLRQNLFHWALGIYEYPHTEAPYLGGELDEHQTLDVPKPDQDWISYAISLPHVDLLKTRRGLEGLIKRLPLQYQGTLYLPRDVEVREVSVNTNRSAWKLDEHTLGKNTLIGQRFDRKLRVSIKGYASRFINPVNMDSEIESACWTSYLSRLQHWLTNMLPSNLSVEYELCPPFANRSKIGRRFSFPLGAGFCLGIPTR